MVNYKPPGPYLGTGDIVVIDSKEHKIIATNQPPYYAATNPSFPLKFDSFATATPGIKVERKWKRKGDLLVDEYTGDYIPLRKLPKELRKQYE